MQFQTCRVQQRAFKRPTCPQFAIDQDQEPEEGPEEDQQEQEQEELGKPRETTMEEDVWLYSSSSGCDELLGYACGMFCNLNFTSNKALCQGKSQQ